MKKKSSSHKLKNALTAVAVSVFALIALAAFNDNVSTAAASVMHRAAIFRESGNCIHVKGVRGLIMNNFHMCQPPVEEQTQE